MINAGMKLLLRRIIALFVCFAVLSPALADSGCGNDCHAKMMPSDMTPIAWSPATSACDASTNDGVSQHCDDAMGQCSYFGPTPQAVQSGSISHDTDASDVDKQSPVRTQSALFKPPRMTTFKPSVVS